MSDRVTPQPDQPDPHPERPGSAGEHVLQDALGTSDRAERFHADQMCDRLVPAMQEFVARMSMAFVATSDAHGECDSTLRAGPPGFLRVLDDRHLAWPEYRGNGVMASLGNITENPHVGLLMVDFTDELIGLHVNGSARLVDDVLLRSAHPDLPEESVPGRKADVWVEVTVEEAYIHCRKHIPRMVPVDRKRSWGTDDARRKGGDHFGVAGARRAEARAAREGVSDPHAAAGAGAGASSGE
ncbi:pyridoxamine 5'-phosphate oxidase family protein [Actinomycetospora straminea]|uniref:Pyridoxamine 5'-phosphate oxidase family protein n=1 Tax=Actinomycetospora straminea TaxID=663607 RepID=A0ABP9E9M7_9PSEU|nr:pyridoxamine 5'-phosphate oxidase family protein [Actinomycetospora straminea]MDD7936027.1 pyridoxamine 5'-phosphate oxidase family protein [Actinomycetospora straminea]